MKFRVIVNELGQVLAAAPVGTNRSENGLKVEVGVVPETGQTLHEIDIEEDLSKYDAADIHKKLQAIIYARLKS